MSPRVQGCPRKPCCASHTCEHFERNSNASSKSTHYLIDVHDRCCDHCGARRPASGHLAASRPPGSGRLLHAEKPIKGQYIVILDGTILPGQVPGIATNLSIRHGGRLRRVMNSAANGFSVELNEQQALQLANEPGVALVEENGYAELADNVSQAQTTVSTILRRPKISPNDSVNVGQNNACETGSGVLVYVVDTGVNRDHTQFSVGGGTKVLNGVDFADDRDVYNNPVAYPYPGESDDKGTWPCGGFTGDMAESDPARTLNGGHGTGVASLIAGNTWGVAPGAQIVPVKVGSCPPADHFLYPNAPQQIVITTESICWGLDWIRSTNNPYRDQHQLGGQPAVVNMSIFKRPGIDYYIDSMEYVINGLVLDNYDPAGGNRPAWNGITVVVSANNQDTDAATTSPARMAYNNIASCPNAYCSPGHVVSVGATRNNTTRWDCANTAFDTCSPNDPGSNYGFPGYYYGTTPPTLVTGAVDIYAPGHDMTAASISNSVSYRVTYTARSGTSFAAPVVTGVVALLLQQQPTLKPPQVWDWLNNHAATLANTGDPLGIGPIKFVQAPFCW